MKGLFQKIQNILGSTVWLVLELLIVLFLALIQSPILTFAILLFCVIRLCTRKISLADLGFVQIQNIPSALGAGLLIAILYQAASLFLFVPILQSLTNTRIDLSAITALKANWANLAIALFISWTFAAFGEEIAYRSYVYSRLVQLFNNRRIGPVVGVALSTVLFAAGHGYQGISGLLENTLFGLTMALVFILSNRNLWLPIITHGFVDTIGFLLIFSGMYP